MLTIITSRRFSNHLTPPGHPECVERAEVMQAVAAEARAAGIAVLEPQPATDAQLLRVHEATYLRAVLATSGRPVAFDADTMTSPESVELARLAAGAACQAVDVVLDGQARRAAAFVRPPGHHAESGLAMGFCLFNNIAVVAAHARAHGVGRVAIVDFDVHHGNGTQWSFYDDPSVLFISTHQFPFYPGTGAAAEAGAGAGLGFTVNVPMEAGCGDADYATVFDRVVLPVVRRFRPELLLVSAGFDAHAADPLAGMQVTTDGFGRMCRTLVRLADEVCHGRIVAVTEGGYDLPALGGSLRALVAAFGEMAPAAGAAAVAEVAGTAVRGARAVDAVRAVHARRWQL
ncbi:MAG: histone deacetylase [Vicinamibacterales bacterium]